MEQLLASLDERQRKLIIGCLGVLVLVAAVMYGFVPKVKELIALRESYAVLTQTTKNAQGAAGEIEHLQQQIEDLTVRLRGDMANLPARQMESFIIGRLQKISWRNDVTLVSVEPTVGESVEMYREVLFSVELTGDYFDLLAWLGDVSGELGFVVIKDFQLGVASPDPDNPKLTTRLKLAAYRVIQDA